MKRRPVPSTRATRLVAPSVLSAAALLLTGCAELSQQATTLEYDPADGVSTTVGSVSFRDVMLISNGSGPASMTGMAENPSGAAVPVTIYLGNRSLGRVTLPPTSTVRLDGKSDGNSTATVAPVKVSGIPKPGNSADLQLQSPNSGRVAVKVPILLDQYPYGTQTVEHAPGVSPTHEGGEEGGGGH